jgi:hypothetical protein
MRCGEWGVAKFEVHKQASTHMQHTNTMPTKHQIQIHLHKFCPKIISKFSQKVSNKHVKLTAQSFCMIRFAFSKS